LCSFTKNTLKTSSNNLKKTTSSQSDVFYEAIKKSNTSPADLIVKLIEDLLNQDDFYEHYSRILKCLKKKAEKFQRSTNNQRINSNELEIKKPHIVASSLSSKAKVQLSNEKCANAQINKPRINGATNSTSSSSIKNQTNKLTKSINCNNVKMIKSNKICSKLEKNQQTEAIYTELKESKEKCKSLELMYQAKSKEAAQYVNLFK
jgi:hypothetical protein